MRPIASGTAINTVKAQTSLFSSGFGLNTGGVIGTTSNLFGGGQTTNLPTTEVLSGSAFSTIPSETANKFGSSPTFGAATTASAPFGGGGGISFGGFGGSTTAAAAQPTFGGNIQQQSTFAPSSIPVAPSSIANKPFITVAPTYTPPSDLSKLNQPTSDSTLSNKNAVVNAAAVRKMISEEMHAFDSGLRALLQRSQKIKLNFGDKEQNELAARQLKQMQSFAVQATESTEALSAEIQSLRISVDEAFAMATEAKSKHQLYTSKTLVS